MEIHDLREAVAEAERFLARAATLRDALKKYEADRVEARRRGDFNYSYPNAEAAAVKRASMDLSKALPRLRRSR